MSYPAQDKPRRQMEIGLIAYGLDGHDPSLVFVRVPTERGRWVLTDRCVIEVACSYCGAVLGEPCRRGAGRNALKHGAGTHWYRRAEWQRLKADPKRQRKLRMRIPQEDVAAARGDAEQEQEHEC